MTAANCHWLIGTLTCDPCFIVVQPSHWHSFSLRHCLHNAKVKRLLNAFCSHTTVCRLKTTSLLFWVPSKFHTGYIEMSNVIQYFCLIVDIGSWSVGVYVGTLLHLTHQFVLTLLTAQGITIATSHFVTLLWSCWEHMIWLHTHKMTSPHLCCSLEM